MNLPASIISFLEKNPIIINDVGARNGFHDFPQLAKWMLVHAYEADPEEGKRMLKLEHGFRNFFVHPFGLGEKAGKRNFYLTKRRSFSSFLEFDEKEFDKYFGRMKNAAEWKACFELEQTIEINCLTLDHMFPRFKPHPVIVNKRTIFDFLKLDTQGTELEILHGAKYQLDQKEINIIETEVNMQPVYKGQPPFSVIDNFLRQQGFLLVDYRINIQAFEELDSSESTVENPHPVNGGDAVYVLDMNLISEEQRNDRALKSALLLAHKGYLSVAEHLLKTFTNVSPEEIEEIFKTLNSISAQEKRKNFARKWLPPGLIAKLK